MVLAIALIGYEVYALFLVSHGTPSTSRSALARLVPSGGDAALFAQTFRVQARALVGVTIHAKARADAQGDVGFRLVELEPVDPQRSAYVERAIFRVERPVADVVGEDGYEVPLPRLDASQDKLYRLEIVPPPGSGLTLLANADDLYAAGTLFIDGKEQWGDLVFSTRATGATAFRSLERRVRSLAPHLPADVIAGGFLVLYNVVLLLLFRGVAAGSGSTAEEGSAPSQRGLDRVRMAVIAAALVGGAAAYWMWAVPERLEPGALDMLAAFPDAEKRTTMASMHEAFRIEDVSIGRSTKHALLALPFSRVTWRVRVTEAARLRAAAAFRPDAWTQSNDGAMFRIGVSDGRTYTEVFRQYVMPFTLPRDRRWFPVEVDLAPWSGRTVDVIFNTEPGEIGNAVHDATVWGSPRILGASAAETR